jgi:hypothetical protein
MHVLERVIVGQTRRVRSADRTYRNETEVKGKLVKRAADSVSCRIQLVDAGG